MSTQQDTIEFSIPSQFGYEKVIREACKLIGRRVGIKGERAADLQVALCEACINAMEHGNQGRTDLRVRVTFTLDGDYLDATVIDHGVAQYTPPAEPACIETKIQGLAPCRGMGLMLIRQLVDECGFVPTPHGSGNIFRIRLYR